MKTIYMPESGQTTDEIMITKWYKLEGEFVKTGDVLFSVETDKAIFEVESYCEGYLHSILYSEGDFVSSGAEVAYINQTGSEHKNDKVLSSPLAKKIAADAGLTLEEIFSGNKKVIKKNDVTEFINKNQESIASDDNKAIPNQINKAVTQQQQYNNISGVPQFTISIEADMTQCIKILNALNSYLNDNAKITFNDIIGKCVAYSIGKHPDINVSYDGDRIIMLDDVNIGFVVESEHGIVIPVISQLNKKKLSEIAIENSINKKSAQSSGLSADKLFQRAITIFNLGMYKINTFNAVVNPSDSCILAIGEITEKPVSINGEIISRNYVNITASFNRRLINEIQGAKFLSGLKAILETPETLFI